MPRVNNSIIHVSTFHVSTFLCDTYDICFVEKKTTKAFWRAYPNLVFF